jgi:tetratricopeptide (TPR) repeat protein
MPFPARLLTSVALVASLALPAMAQNGDAGAYLAARSAAINSDYRAAAGWYARALVQDPANTALLEGVVASNLGIGDFNLAAVAGQRLIDLGQPGQLAPIAVLAQRAQKADFAGILAEKTTAASVGALFDQLTRAWAELGNGRMSEALAGFDAVAKTPGMEAFGLYHKALALASVGDYEGADNILSGRANGPINIMRRGVIAHVQILSQLEKNPDALALLDRSFGAEADPTIDALRARLTAGEPIPYDVTRNATDGLAEVFFTLATALNGEADPSFTLIYARAAAYLRPDHTEATLLAAGMLEEQGQYDLATETYAKIAPTDPAFHIAEIGRAGALRATGKTEAATEVLQTLARNQPGIMGVQLALADSLRRDEKWADAITAYDAAIALVTAPDAQHWTLFYSRGVARERLADWAGAEADMRRALELQPDQPQVLNYLGYSFVDRGIHLDEALGMIERAVKAEPDQGYIIDSLAWAYFRLGRYKDALVPMEKASLLDPVDATVTDHLGDVYWANGRILEAQFQWRRALSFDPAEADATRIRHKLEVGLDAVRAEEGAKPLTPMATDAGAVPATDGN